MKIINIFMGFALLGLTGLSSCKDAKAEVRKETKNMSLKKEKMMFSDEPILSLKISAYLCEEFDLKVNDVIVASNERNRPMELTVPINQWVQNGENHISIVQNITNQKSLEGSMCEVSLMIKQKGDERSMQKLITNIKLEKGQNLSLPENKLNEVNLKKTLDGNIIINKANISKQENKLILERVVSLPLNFPKWKWLSSDQIKDTKETRASLYKEYEKMHKILEDKNFSVLNELMDERLKEFASSLYLTHKEMVEQTGLISDASNEEMVLASLMPQQLKIEIMGNDKLVKITRWNGYAQIAFYYKDESASVFYDMIYRKSGDKWILTR